MQLLEDSHTHSSPPSNCFQRRNLRKLLPKAPGVTVANMQGIKPYLIGVLLPAMSPISAHLSQSALGRLGRFSRSISSISHLTKAERRLYFEHLNANSQLQAQLPTHRISQGPPAPRFLRPQIHDTQSSSWVALENIIREGLERGRVLKVVSWNIECFGLGQAARAFAALGHLKGLLGKNQVLLSSCSKKSVVNRFK